MHLSPHFTLDELTTTSHHWIDNAPGADVTERLRELAVTVLERIRERFGPIRVTSGYRCASLNATIRGARDSAHLYGCAADIQAVNGASPTAIVAWVVECSGIDYDQVIDEQRGRSKWVHIGMLRPNHEDKPRRQALTMRDGKYATFHVKTTWQ